MYTIMFRATIFHEIPQQNRLKPLNNMNRSLRTFDMAAYLELADFMLALRSVPFKTYAVCILRSLQCTGRCVE